MLLGDFFERGNIGTARDNDRRLSDSLRGAERIKNFLAIVLLEMHVGQNEIGSRSMGIEVEPAKIADDLGAIGYNHHFAIDAAGFYRCIGASCRKIEPQL